MLNGDVKNKTPGNQIIFEIDTFTFGVYNFGDPYSLARNARRKGSRALGPS